jgi:hypothetical protein
VLFTCQDRLPTGCHTELQATFRVPHVLLGFGPSSNGRGEKHLCDMSQTALTTFSHNALSPRIPT